MIKAFFEDGFNLFMAGIFIGLIMGMVMGGSIVKETYKKGMDKLKDQAVSLDYGSYVVHTNQSNERVISFQWNTNK